MVQTLWCIVWQRPDICDSLDVVIMKLFGKDPEKKKNAQMVKSIRNLVRKKEYDAALKLGVTYLQRVPENFDILFVVGGILYNKRRYSKALIYFEQAVEIGRYDPEVLSLKAECHMRLGQMDKARLCWQDILEVDPKNSHAQKMLG